MKLSTLAFTALFFASVAFAQDASPGAGPSAAPKKATASPQERFKKFDKDGDNSISLEEFSKGAKDPAKASETFKKKDKDNDGKLTLEEFLKKAAKKEGAAAD